VLRRVRFQEACRDTFCTLNAFRNSPRHNHVRHGACSSRVFCFGHSKGFPWPQSIQHGRPGYCANVPVMTTLAHQDPPILSCFTGTPCSAAISNRELSCFAVRWPRIPISVRGPDSSPLQTHLRTVEHIPSREFPSISLPVQYSLSSYCSTPDSLQSY
jgi:hypothetical protein